MAEIPRLNGVIKALAEGKTAFVGFASADIETASALGGSSYDGVAFEMEHAPMSAPALRDALQYMLDRRQILEGGTLAPKVTPMVRIPPNGGEMNQWICQDHNVPCGHPHPDARNIERLIASGYRFLMPSTPRSFAVLEQGRKLAGR